MAPRAGRTPKARSGYGKLSPSAGPVMTAQIATPNAMPAPASVASSRARGSFRVPRRRRSKTATARIVALGRRLRVPGDRNEARVLVGALEQVVGGQRVYRVHGAGPDQSQADDEGDGIPADPAVGEREERGEERHHDRGPLGDRVAEGSREELEGAPGLGGCLKVKRWGGDAEVDAEQAERERQRRNPRTAHVARTAAGHRLPAGACSRCVQVSRRDIARLCDK